MRDGRATYDDLLALPEHVIGELIDGELIVSPRPAPPHAVAGSVITMDLGPLHGPPGGGRGPGGWWILFEPELHFGEDVLVPDLAGWRRERMPKLPATAAFELAPDWVCEIVSPHEMTGKLDRKKKNPVYARVNVPHLWLVDPLQRYLEVFRLESNGWLRVAVHADDEKVRVAPFEVLELELSRWWAEVEG